MQRLLASLIVAVAVLMTSAIVQADLVRTKDGVFEAPGPGEEVVGAGTIDPVTGICTFDVGSTGPTLLFNSDTCTVTIDPDTTTSPRRRTVTEWPGGAAAMHPPIPGAPDPNFAENNPTIRHRKGNTRHLDPTLLQSVPEDNGEPLSKAGGPRYNVGCPRVGVKMWSNARWERATYYGWRSYISLYAQNKFFVNLYNGGIGSILPYQPPNGWATWYLSSTAYYSDTWRFWGWGGWGPTANGSGFVSSYSIAYFGGANGRWSNHWTSVSSYRDLNVIPACNIQGNPGPGSYRQRCRGSLGVGYQEC